MEERRRPISHRSSIFVLKSILRKISTAKHFFLLLPRLSRNTWWQTQPLFRQIILKKILEISDSADLLALQRLQWWHEKLFGGRGLGEVSLDDWSFKCQCCECDWYRSLQFHWQYGVADWSVQNKLKEIERKIFEMIKVVLLQDCAKLCVSYLSVGYYLPRDFHTVKGFIKCKNYNVYWQGIC